MVFVVEWITKDWDNYGHCLCIDRQEIDIINGMDVSDTEELPADMMSLLASFSGKLYGK